MTCFKKAFVVLTLIISLALLLPVNSLRASAAATDKITIAEIPITLNNTLINNINRDYPLLMYKDITYFPLDWTDCRFMGLSSSWTPDSGLSITKTGQSEDYVADEHTINRMDTEYTPNIIDYPITINGISIDNSKEKWPLINFRNITYIPLTWQFAANDLGWSYYWSQDKGLVITSPGGKGDAKETLLTRINALRFGGGYAFKAAFTDRESKETVTYEGKVTNAIDQTEPAQYTSTVTFSQSEPYSGGDAADTGNTSIQKVTRSYKDFNPREIDSTGYGYTSNQSGLAVGPALADSDPARFAFRLLDLHFAENMVGIQYMDQNANGENNWQLTTSDSHIIIRLLNGKITGFTINTDQFTADVTIL